MYFFSNLYILWYCNLETIVKESAIFYWNVVLQSNHCVFLIFFRYFSHFDSVLTSSFTSAPNHLIWFRNIVEIVLYKVYPFCNYQKSKMANTTSHRIIIGICILFSYLMVSGAIDWNICPEVLGMTKGSIAWGHRPIAREPLVIPRTKGHMFQSIAPETIK